MKRTELSDLLKSLGEQFDAEIGKLNFKKKQKEDLSAGFRDGARSVAIALQQQGHLKVED